MSHAGTAGLPEPIISRAHQQGKGVLSGVFAHYGRAMWRGGRLLGPMWCPGPMG